MTTTTKFSAERLFEVDEPPRFASRMELIDAQALAAGGHFGDLASCRAALAELGLREGLPFLIDEHGRPLRNINRWVKSLATRGAGAHNTALAYAGDMLAWHRHCATHDVDVLDATADHLDSYYDCRRVEAGPSETLVDVSTWNRWVAAVDNFYRWADSQGLNPVNPFTYETVTAFDARYGLVRKVVNNARRRGGRPHAQILWLEKDHLSYFLDIGISGLLPDRSPDPAFKGRNVPRNRAVAAAALAGLRQREVTHLFEVEVPPLPDRRLSHEWLHLPASITKGNKPRQTLIAVANLRMIHDYLRHERQDTAGGSWAPSAPVLIKDLDARGGRVDGTVTRSELMSRDLRRRLIDDDGASPLAFLSSQGAPLLNLRHIFSAATARCQRFDSSFPKVTPHTMRHTFAVHMFRWLTRMAQAHAQRHAAEFGFEIWAPYFAGNDPMISLQRMLGHASLMTTEMYLRGMDPTREYLNLLAEADDDDH